MLHSSLGSAAIASSDKIVFRLRGLLLRELAGFFGHRPEGISQAARILWRRGQLHPKLVSKTIKLDECYHIIRHTNVKNVEEAHQSVVSELASRASGIGDPMLDQTKRCRQSAEVQMSATSEFEHMHHESETESTSSGSQALDCPSMKAATRTDVGSEHRIVVFSEREKVEQSTVAAMRKLQFVVEECAMGLPEPIGCGGGGALEEYQASDEAALHDTADDAQASHGSEVVDDVETWASIRFHCAALRRKIDKVIFEMYVGHIRGITFFGFMAGAYNHMSGRILYRRFGCDTGKQWSISEYLDARLSSTTFERDF
ncbi:unnamed protein product [Prorocentrum cordatum]|uniref:Uncharacterized protein n=1 Tax=Prorocentrum cordatum TaxID=2364126 RepID=A0ABN9WNA6_9DINO|nr:unnamed protein product [Polarella glacialis]